MDKAMKVIYMFLAGVAISLAVYAIHEKLAEREFDDYLASGCDDAD